MLNLPLALRLEKNKLVSTAPWLVFLTVTLPDTTVLRLVKNTEDITFQSHIYTAFAFDLGDGKSGGDGQIQGLSLKVANPERAFSTYMETYAGLVGCPVTLSVVHADNLDSDYTELTLNWDILASVVEDTWITFSLGAENPFRRRFPLQSATPTSCNWIFKGVECAYAGASTSCARSLDACRVLGNSSRFGGRPGILGAPRFVSA